MFRLLTIVSVLLIAMPAMAQAPFALKEVANGLDLPVLVAAPAGDPRLFIVEQTGFIRIMEGGVIAESPFLDINHNVSNGGEQGLLGLAFHPDYAANGRFFINYTDTSGDTRIAEYKVSAADPDAADPSSAKELLFVDQPARNHNGGWIAFGPDGLLYIAMGDGGGAGDPRNNAQNDKVLLGKILTLDVEAGGPPQVFAKGVRNPWRNDFDGNDLYIADVGQDQWEEINIVGVDQKGANLGWRRMEGDVCFDEINCESAKFTLPAHVYNHQNGGCSITGGYVYRGKAIPALDGVYLYSDYCAGTLSSLRKSGDGVTDVTSYADAFGTLGNVTSFGEDGAGELYVMTQEGILLQLVPPAE